MEHRNRGLSGMNEDFERCPTVNGIFAVNLKQVLRSIKNTITSDTPQLAENLSALQCKEGIKQFNLLKRKIQSFKIVISAQLDENELTFIRYTDTVEQVYFEVLKNLQQFYLAMTSIETINERQLATRLMTKYVKNESEKKALQQRLDLWRSQMKIAEELLVQNEQMLTKLDLITSQIANIELKNIRARLRVAEVAVTKMLDVNS
jgi:Leucine-rich repeat (LRR) protein